MKKSLGFVLLFVFLFAESISSKSIHPAVEFSGLTFSEDQNGDIIAFSPSNPGLMYEFEYPVLCDRIGSLFPGDGDTPPYCGSPNVFMKKSGIVKLWEGKDLLSYERGGISLTEQILGSMPDYYVVGTPRSVYYCVYKDHASSTCRIFPDDNPDNPIIKVGDRFAACATDLSSWPMDKNGVRYDCSKPTKNLLNHKQILYVGRIAEFAVESISPEDGVFLRCINRYGIGAISPIPLNENKRLDMMGSMSLQPNIFFMVKLKNPKINKK